MYLHTEALEAARERLYHLHELYDPEEGPNPDVLFKHLEAVIIATANMVLAMAKENNIEHRRSSLMD